MMRRFSAVVLLLLCAAGVRPAAAQLASGDLSLSGTTTIPFTLSGNHIYVRGTVDGKPYAFIFDTGGAASLSPAAEDALALPVIGHARLGGAGNAVNDTVIVQVPEMDFGGVSYKGGAFVVLPTLALVSPFKGVPYGGIIGREIFGKLIVTIDYANSQLIFTQPAVFSAPKGATEVALSMRRGAIPNIPAAVNGHSGSFDVDAGAGGSLTVTQAFAQSSGLDNEFDKTLAVEIGRGVGGPMMGNVGRGRTFQMGNVQLHDVLVAVAGPGGGVFAQPDLAGNIGAEILKRFTVTLDVPDSKLYLLPNATFSTPFVYNRAGLSVLPQGAQWSVASVVPGSPAAQAGIMAGDVVISVNGQSPSDLGANGLHNAWYAAAGTVVQVVLERNGVRSTKSLTLRDLI
ncbi:MAG TPA: aspartyl protease family protein [Candidatus Rubrimentiphilum sp.]|nr:aspartyl protease family protein [Candidatus Rubrimentiphilum sp.]